MQNIKDIIVCRVGVVSLGQVRNDLFMYLSCMKNLCMLYMYVALHMTVSTNCLHKLRTGH